MPEPEPRLSGTTGAGLSGTTGPGPVGRPEPEPRLICEYLAGLTARLPSSITGELADGLTETYRFYLAQGLAAEVAAEAAVSEFGAPETIVAGFARVNPARRAARRLLGIGPAVGACWVAALVTSPAARAWVSRAGWPGREAPWSGPGLALGVAVALAGLVGLLAVAALGRRYRLAAVTGVAGCVGYAALDVTLIAGACFMLAPVGWMTAAAMAASFARIGVTARLLRPALAR